VDGFENRVGPASRISSTCSDHAAAASARVAGSVAPPAFRITTGPAVCEITSVATTWSGQRSVIVPWS
jgi:hypothetical protein